MRRPVQVTIMAALLSPLVTHADQLNLLDYFLTPPFNQVVIGKRHDGDVNAGVPKMHSSAVITVYNNCKSEIKTDHHPLDINFKPVIQPEVLKKISKSHSDSSFSLKPEVFRMQHAAEAQKLTIFQHSNSMATFTEKSKLAMQNHEDILDKSTRHSVFETKTESFDTRKEKTIASIASLESTHKTESHVVSGRNTLVFTETTLKKTDTQGVETTAHGKMTISSLSNRTGSFSVFDEDDLASLTEFDKTPGGFYDNDNAQFSNYVDNALSLREQDELKFDLCSEAAFAKIFRKLARKPPEMCADEPTLALETAAFPNNFFHGHKAELVVKVKNIGKSPAYNVLILAAIPDNTTFLEFNRGNIESGRSYSELYAKACNTVAILLNKPLLPGGMFKSNTFVKVAPWISGEKIEISD